MKKAKSSIKSMKKVAEKGPFPSKEATEAKKAMAKRGFEHLNSLMRVSYR